MSIDVWRSEERYQALNACSAPDLAWEFLRRNPDYRADYQQSNGAASDESSAAAEARWARWGLSFRRRPRAPCGRATGLLAA